MSKTETNNQENAAKPQETVPRKPNEHGTVRVESYFKIWDPQTQRVYVEGRA